MIKKLKILIVVLSLLALSSIAGYAAEVKIHGKTLDKINDIIAETSSADGGIELPKHSLLFVERVPVETSGGYDTYIQPYVFTFKTDGSVNQKYTLPKIDNIGEFSPHATNTMKMMNVAVSSKRYGTKRNVVYFGGGNNSNNISAPTQVFDQTLKDGKVEVTASTLDKRHATTDAINVWGSDSMTVNGYDKDLFVYAHSSYMGSSGKVIFDFLGVDRNETGTVDLERSLTTYNALDYNNGIRSVSIATGDFDGDGYKNEIGLSFSNDNSVTAYFYRVTYSNGNLSITRTHEQLLHTGSSYQSKETWEQAMSNALVGDFDGDGRQEFATVFRVYISNPSYPRLVIFKYDTSNQTWSHDYLDLGTYRAEGEGPTRAARADLDGDGKDEIVLLRFPLENGWVGMDLDYVWCDAGTIKPKRDWNKYHRGGPGSDIVLGWNLRGDYLNTYYYFNESFNIIAGPLTGKTGKKKLADDIVITHTYDTTKAYLIATNLDSKMDFSGFGASTKFFEETVPLANKYYARIAVKTDDFANESLMLGDPIHQVRYKDTSYVTVFQALPYHVDTVDEDGEKINSGTWKEAVTNFTYSGFGDSDGKMQVSYETSRTDTETQSVKFGTSSTKETILALGDDLGGKVLTGLKVAKTAASALGGIPIFGKIAEKVAQGIQTVMDKVTDKIQTVKSEINNSSVSVKIRSKFTAYDKDEVTVYTSPLHIWRYPILNVTLPEWYVEGKRLDYESEDVTGSNAKQYITFTMYSKPEKVEADSGTNEIYQPLHEEGNFFSYPTNVEDTEGFNKAGMLADVHTVSLGSVARLEEVEFTKAKENMEETDEQIQRSELSDNLEALSDLLGVEALASNIPPYTSHNEKFAKKYATDEKVTVELQGRSELPYGTANHDLKFAPYVAKEGTMKFATAVRLRNDTGAMLWRSGSLYVDRTDPALLLPHKFSRSGKKFIAIRDNFYATKLRGMRFYLTKLNKFTDSDLINNLTYEIRVPLYNASFKSTGDFKVRLSRTTDPNVKETDLVTAPKTVIGEVTKSLHGWDNTASKNNKDWAVFNWTPSGIAKGKYYFWVEIDPDNELKNEVHESRFAADGTVQDWGGNNVGHVLFNMHNPGDKVTDPKLLLSKVDGGSIAASNEFIVSSIHAAASSDSTVPEGKIRVTMKLQGTGDITALHDYLESQEDKELPVPVTCEVMYEGDYVYPDVTIIGYNFEASAAGKNYQNLDDSDIGTAFMYKEVTMFPGESYTYTFMVKPSSVNWDNGINIELKTPTQKIAQAGNGAEAESGGTISSSSSGCDLGSGSCIMLGLAYLVLKIKKGKR